MYKWIQGCGSAIFLCEWLEFCYFCGMKDNKKTDAVMIALLRERVEEVTKRPMKSPSDFEWLSERLGEMGESMSTTTIKRCWGYVDADVTPRLRTLDILARYLGYRDYEHFAVAHDTLEDGTPSAPVHGFTLRPSVDLDINDRVMLTWQPGRVCVIRYLGNEQFVVERSERTRLQPGNTFNCGIIIEGEQLYLHNLKSSHRKTVSSALFFKTKMRLSESKLSPSSKRCEREHFI